MHLLHAKLQWASWTGEHRGAAGVSIDAGAMAFELGDVVLIPLTLLFHPFLAHACFAAVAVGWVCFGAWRLASSFGHRPGVPWLLVPLIAVGFPLVLGFFHFMIACGTVMAFAGCWQRQRTLDRNTLVHLAFAIALCQFAHRSGGLLLLGIIAVQELFLFLGSRRSAHVRWGFLPGPWQVLIVLVTLAFGIYQLGFNTRLAFPPVSMPSDGSNTVPGLRSLLMLDQHAERPILFAVAATMLLFTALAFRQRWHRDFNLNPPDTLLFVAVLLFIGAIWADTPQGILFYLPVRLQWFGLLLLACWCSLYVPVTRSSGMLAALLVLTHVLRMVYLEKRMEFYADGDHAALRTQAYSQPDQLVVPIDLDPDWLTLHRTAYAAMAYDGIAYSPRDHVRFQGPGHRRNAFSGNLHEPLADMIWLQEHVRAAADPPITHVWVLGSWPTVPPEHLCTLQAFLNERFVRVHADTDLEVWTARSAFPGPGLPPFGRSPATGQ